MGPAAGGSRRAGKIWAVPSKERPLAVGSPRIRPGRRPSDPSPSELRLVLSLWPLLVERIDGLRLGRGGHAIAPIPDQLRWAGLYELPFPRHLAAAAVAFDMDRELIGAARQAIPVASLARLTSVYVKHDARGSGAGLEGQIAAETWTKASYLRSMRESLRALLVFGLSLNELVGRARDVGDDRALLDAIRIDPGVILGTTGATRLARALLEHDGRCVRAVNIALSEGLAPRQRARERTGVAAVEALAGTAWEELGDRRLLALFRMLRREADAHGRTGGRRTRARLARLAAERVSGTGKAPSRA